MGTQVRDARLGLGWHKSHHEPRNGWFEKNDLYAVVFAGVAILLIVLARPVITRWNGSAPG